METNDRNIHRLTTCAYCSTPINNQTQTYHYYHYTFCSLDCRTDWKEE